METFIPHSSNEKYIKFPLKSALLFTGNIRTFELCIKSFEKICEKFNPDIYIYMSNIEHDLHPYIKKKYNFYNDNILTLEQIKLKFNLSPIFSSKIKILKVLNNKEENDIINYKYLHKFDKKKEWTGIDIFKQYYKFNLGLKEIELYEKQNNIKYNYIIKTRFDLEIDINTLPIFPLENNNIYIKNEYISDYINDLIFIGNNIEILKTITSNVINIFLNNNVNNETNEKYNSSYDESPLCGAAGISSDKETYDFDSIHTILKHVFKKNNIIPNQNISCILNRNYGEVFNIKISLVTCFYNINRDSWKNSNRPIDKYFINCENVLKQKCPLYIFTTEEYVERCRHIRMKTDINMLYTKIIIIPFEKLYLYDKINEINKIQQNNITNIYPERERINPEFCIPEYIVLINNKVKFLKHVTENNIFESTIFQWIDFGIHQHLLGNNFNENYFNNIFYKSNKIKIVGFKPIDIDITKNNRKSFYNTHQSTLACSLFGGDHNSINTLCNLHEKEFEFMFNEGLMNQEQYILYYIACKNKNLFDYILHNKWSELLTKYSNNSNLKIALCMSGHIRSYNICKQNIYDNIINPLKNIGCNINIFLSSWNDYGFRSDNFNTSIIDKTNINLDDFTLYDFEESRQEYFINKFSTNKWKENPNLSCLTTCPDSASQIYKLSKTYNMAKDYAKLYNYENDIIIRIRPDLTFNTIIDISHIKNCLLNNNIYMPESHGNYPEVTKYMMDHYFFGNTRSMNIIMNTYNNLDILIKSNCPHTTEGFLWGQLFMNNIKLIRFVCAYGIIDKNKNYISLYK
jgi:hypothetical protein